MQLDYLCKLETDTDIRDALEDMPSGLTNTYVRILKEIDRQEPLQKAFAIACFRWVLSANRELRWVELELVLPLARLHRPKSFRDCLDGPLITALASACGNLVHIPKNQTNWWWGDEKITFIHSSVFQFFSVNLSSLGFAGDPWNVLSDRNAMHRKNASDCLTFISLLIEDLDYSRDLGKQVEYTAFAYYAFHNFDKHVIASSEQSTACPSMLDSVQKMLARDEVFLETFLRLRLILQPDVAKGVVESRCPENLVTPVISDHILWTTQLYKIPGISQPPRPPGETLRLLSKGGLYEATKNLLNEETFTSGACSIDEEDQSGSSAIDYASEYGQTSIVDLLLHEGASPEPTPVRQNGSLQVYFGKRTPLFVAVAEGHHAVVKILLRAGVDAKAPVRLYGSLRSPLELATSQGDQLIADLLVRHGAGTQSFESGDAVGGAERD